jgi:antitoxin component of RelBE/YafQ-DinJ toxin-antitoxin module
MGESSMLHVRVDDDVKAQATEAIGGNGIVGV